ncbi:hypothetical protein FPRO06_00274 [Fusarium proliferatum]|nr:hypothetical protein FPRO06_00274 [Fusarium proliferatum]
MAIIDINTILDPPMKLAAKLKDTLNAITPRLPNDIRDKHRWYQCTIQNATQFDIRLEDSYFNAGKYLTAPNLVGLYGQMTFTAYNDRFAASTGLSFSAHLDIEHFTMDPLSIASSVVGLTATCLSTCKKLHDLAGEYQDVPAVIAMICSESTIISIGLSELQMKILRRDDLAQAWASKTEIWTAFETALTGCMVVFSCLEAETRSLRSKNPGVWAKIKFIWNQDRLKELLGALRAQQSSITFLLNLLELETLSNIQKDIRKNAPKIKAAASEAQSLRSYEPSVKMESESIFDNNAANLSFFHVEAVSGNAPSELDFEFGDLIVNSQAYRRVFIKAQAETKQPEIEEVDSDTGTDCGKSLENDHHPSTEGNDVPSKLICEEDYVRRRDVKCFKCHETISGDSITALNRWYHPHHFTCDQCDIVFAQEIDSHQHNGGIYCLLHFCREVKNYCHACKFPIVARYNERRDQNVKWHASCFELSSWGLDVPVSAHGRQYLDSIEALSTLRLDKFYQELHDSRANEIYLCGSRF